MILPTVYIGATAVKGRGIFAKAAIKTGTVIENSPVIVLAPADRKLLDQTLLHDYIFEWQPEGLELCCMALGWLPLYNHSYLSNCEYFMEYDEQTMYIQAIRDIKPGEELTINYNGDWNNEAKVWFDVV
jgi:SET domain-containing protein